MNPHPFILQRGKQRAWLGKQLIWSHSWWVTELGWVTTCLISNLDPFYSTSSPKKWMSLSCVQLLVIPWNSPDQNTGMGSLSLLQGIFLTQVLLKKIANLLTLKTIPESGHLSFIDFPSSIMYFPFFLVRKCIKYFIYIQKKDGLTPLSLTYQAILYENKGLQSSKKSWNCATAFQKTSNLLN